MGSLINNYVFKALDAFPYDMEEVMESLNYALSYDDKNSTALCLMGRVYSEVLKDFDEAKKYFAEALSENVHAIAVYPHYINVLLWNEDYIEAGKLIEFALNVKGAEKGVIYWKKALMFEMQGRYKKALKNLKKARENTYCSEFYSTLSEEKDRIKGKLPKVKVKKNNKKK
jgi:tetratricopeptide (TPR) repeat protein